MLRPKPPVEAPTPTLDPHIIRELAEESSVAAAEDFLSFYAALLPRRVERIVHSIGIGDRPAAMDAVLSLRTASAMAGALEAARLCRLLERAIALADLSTAATVTRDIANHQPVLQKAITACPPVS